MREGMSETTTELDGGRADVQFWFRGQLHAHSYWSDGRGFLEQAVTTHRRRGYHFLFISDHNRFGERPDEWRAVQEEEGPWPPSVSRENFVRYLEEFGADWVDQRSTPDGLQVRLKTFAEVKGAFDVPNEFLLLPAVELTQKVRGRHVHMNTLNLPEILPGNRGAALVQTLDNELSMPGLLARNSAEALAAAAARKQPCLLMLNHPFWPYYDVTPWDILDRPEIRLVEICGGSGAVRAPSPSVPGYTLETFWDIANAFRARAGIPLLYGTCGDDAHYYDAKRVDGSNGVGDAWVMVRAPVLNSASLMAALQAGDFYATCGVLLSQVSFRPDTRTLSVKVQAEPDTRYRIQFITTHNDFEDTLAPMELVDGEKLGSRRVPADTSGFGRTVRTVRGTEASYTVSPEDLYVRARVESDRPARNRTFFHPEVMTAWTQPYAAPERAGG